jgi:hypothetical protein
LEELREQFLPLSSSAPAVYWLGCLCSFEDWVLLEERLLELFWFVYWFGCLFSAFWVLFLQLFVRFSMIDGSFQEWLNWSEAAACGILPCQKPEPHSG